MVDTSLVTRFVDIGSRVCASLFGAGVKLAVHIVGLPALIPLHVAIGNSTNVKLAVDLVGQNDGVATVLVFRAAAMAGAKLALLIVLADFSRVVASWNSTS